MIYEILFWLSFRLIIDLLDNNLFPLKVSSVELLEI